MNRKALLTFFSVFILAMSMLCISFNTEAKVIYTKSLRVDAAAEKIINKCTTPDMTKERKLREVYLYLVKNMKHSWSYGRVKIKVTKKDIKNIKAKRKELEKNKQIKYSSAFRKRYRSLLTLRGTCYGQSMAFCIMANHLGFPAKLCHGTFNGNDHFWCYVVIDGKKQYFDVDIANYYWKRSHSMKKVNFFYKKAKNSRAWRKNHRGG